MSNPYRDLPSFCYWSRAMVDVSPWQISPMGATQRILEGERVATMGSCFAQHLSRHLPKRGVNYFIAELPPDGMTEEEVHRRNYTVFSARYGNIYTVRQALQLFKRAFGTFIPEEAPWERGKRFVDPFRPQIEPEGFATKEEVLASTREHLAYVRRVFTESDWLVFTLGLTEAWRSKIDGSVFPIVPGVAGGTFNSANYEFVNFSVDEVRSDLFELLRIVRAVNEKIRVLLTVSPVPLIATYENRHVLVSTTASKAILRVVTDEAERCFDNVFYFPSYEVITSPSAGGNYFADDLRQIREIGVEHVLRVFSEAFLGANPAQRSYLEGIASSEYFRVKGEVICDEDLIIEN